MFARYLCPWSILQDGDLPPLPPGGRRMLPVGGMTPYGVPLTADDQLREASDRLIRLQATAAGPPTLKDSITVCQGQGFLGGWIWGDQG